MILWNHDDHNENDIDNDDKTDNEHDYEKNNKKQ